MRRIVVTAAIVISSSVLVASPAARAGGPSLADPVMLGRMGGALALQELSNGSVNEEEPSFAPLCLVGPLMAVQSMNDPSTWLVPAPEVEPAVPADGRRRFWDWEYPVPEEPAVERPVGVPDVESTDGDASREGTDDRPRWWDWEYPVPPEPTPTDPADGRRRFWDWEYPVPGEEPAVTRRAEEPTSTPAAGEADGKRRFWDWEYPVPDDEPAAVSRPPLEAERHEPPRPTSIVGPPSPIGLALVQLGSLDLPTIPEMVELTQRFGPRAAAALVRELLMVRPAASGDGTGEPDEGCCQPSEALFYPPLW